MARCSDVDINQAPRRAISMEIPGAYFQSSSDITLRVHNEKISPAAEDMWPRNMDGCELREILKP